MDVKSSLFDETVHGDAGKQTTEDTDAGDLDHRTGMGVLIDLTLRVDLFCIHCIELFCGQSNGYLNAAAWLTVKRNMTLMSMDNRCRDGKSKTGGVLLSAGIVSVKGAGNLFFTHAFAVVADGQMDDVFFLPDCDVHARTAAMNDGIIKQIIQRLMQAEAVGLKIELRAGEVNLTALFKALVAHDDAAKKCAEFKTDEMKMNFAVFKAIGQQHVIHHPIDIGELIFNQVDVFLLLVGRLIHLTFQ